MTVQVISVGKRQRPRPRPPEIAQAEIVSPGSLWIVNATVNRDGDSVLAVTALQKRPVALEM